MLLLAPTGGPLGLSAGGLGSPIRNGTLGRSRNSIKLVTSNWVLGIYCMPPSSAWTWGIPGSVRV